MSESDGNVVNRPVYAAWLILNFLRLISASVGTVVYYGFQCYPSLGQPFLGLCFLTGLAGNIFPFMDWFNKTKYRVRNWCYTSYPSSYWSVFSTIVSPSSSAWRSRALAHSLGLQYCIRGRRWLNSWVRLFQYTIPGVVSDGLRHWLYHRPCHSVAAVVPNRSRFLCHSVSRTCSARQRPAASRLHRRRYVLQHLSIERGK